MTEHAQQTLPREAFFLAQRTAQVRDDQQLVRPATFAERRASHFPAAAAARKRAVADAMRAASDELNNTPAIARKSYVDPRLIDAYDGGVTIDPARVASVESELRRLLGAEE